MKKALTVGLLLLILFGVFLIPGQAAYAAGEAPANVTLTEIKPSSSIVIGKIAIDPGTYYPPGKEHLGSPPYPYPTYNQGADCGTEYFTAPSGQAYYCIEKSVRAATSLPSNDPYRGQMQRVGVFTDDHQPPVATKLAAFFAYTENHPDGYTPFVKAGIVWALREQVTLTNSTYVNKYNQFLNAYTANPNHGDFKGATVYRYKDVKTGGTYQDMVTYTYVPYQAMGGFRVRKTDTSGTFLPGAEFDLINSNGVIVRHIVVPATGYTSNIEFITGNYTLVETKAPTGHLLDTTPHPLTITEDQINSVYWDTPITNTPVMGHIKVVKKDNDALPVAGAMFDVKNSSNTVVAQLTTNAQGEATTPALPLGTYTVTETFTPGPFVLDPTPKTVTLAAIDQTTPTVTVTVNFTNTPAQGQIRVIKKGTSGTLVPGAKFDVRNSANTVVAQLTTNAQGEATTPNLPLGTYTVTETFVPSPYILDTTPKTVTISYVNQTTPVVTVETTFTNAPAQGRVRVIKKDTSGTLVPGAKFDVRNSANTVVAQLTTNAQGEATTPNLPLGTYTVTETFVPSPYILDTTPKTVTISYVNQTTPVVTVETTFTNAPALGVIKIRKIDSINANPIKGAVFEVRNAENTVVDTLTTDDNGRATTIQLPLGNYTVKETTPAIGYNPNDMTYPVTLAYKDMETPVVTVQMPTFLNRTIQGRIRIIKLAKGSALPIMGATFEILDSDRAPAVDIYGTPVGELVSDAYGIALTPLLRYGDYIVRETSSPAGYHLNEQEYPVSITVNDETKLLFIQNDKVEVRVRVIKEDALTGDPLAGAVFQILDSENNVIVFSVIRDGNVVEVDRFTTNNDGIGIADGLIPAGTYTLREIEAPPGYVPVDDVSFEVTADTQTELLPILGHTITFNLANNPTEVTISKKALTGEDELPDAHLQLIEESTGNVIDEWVSTTTPHLVRYLESGKTYILRETIAPNGYALAEDVTFTVIGDGTAEQVVMRDDVTHLEIVKKDRKTKAPLAGVVFEIRDATDALTFVYDDVEGVYTWSGIAVGDATSQLATDDEGKIRIEGIPEGNYTLVELAEYPGYIRNSEAISVTVPVDASVNAPHIVEVLNDQNKIVLKKMDAREENVPIVGAEIGIYDDQGTLVKEGITAEDGTVTFEGLAPGTYTYREIKAPVGYRTNTEAFEFIVDAFGNVTGELEFTDEPTRLLIYKVDAADLDKSLSGAVFEIYRIEEGQEPQLMTFALRDGIYYPDVGTDEPLISDENGAIEVRRLPLGDYRIIETKAVPGYLLTPHGYDVTLSEEEAMTGVIAENGETVVILKKLCTKSGLPLAGAEITIYDDTGEIVRTAVTNTEGIAQIIGLPAGTYTYEEAKAPDGYTLAEKVFGFTVNVDGSIVGEIEFENDPTRIVLQKKSTTSDAPLKGAEFELYMMSEEGEEPALMTFTLEEGIYVYDAEGDITTLVTDAEGKIVVEKLPVGNYAFKETKAPKGYTHDATLRPVEVDEAKTVKHVMLKNRPIPPPVPASGERSNGYLVALLILAGLSALGGVVLNSQNRKREEIRD